MSHLPSPDVYLNHFTPSQVIQFEASRNLSLAVFGALIWDILIYIPDDIKIVRRSRPHPVIFAFIFSRLFAAAFVLLAVLMHTRGLSNCQGFAISVGVLIILAMASTSFLFLQRVRALYPENRWVRWAFSALWVACTGVMTTTAIGAKSAHVPGTQYCHYAVVDRYLAAAGFVWLFFDTVVFVAISYQIASAHSVLYSDAKVSWSTVISGKALPRLSRSVLHGGQQYYLIAICFNLPVGIMIAVPETPTIYKLMMSFPLVALTASMACRVFRNMRMHDLRVETQHTVSDVNFRHQFHKSTVNAPPTSQTTEGQTPSRHPVAVSFPHTASSGDSSEDARVCAMA